MAVFFWAGLFATRNVFLLAASAASFSVSADCLYPTQGDTPTHLHEGLNLFVELLNLGLVFPMNSLMVQQLFVDFESFPTFSATMPNRERGEKEKKKKEY